jgi:hypothetical protein
MVDLFSSATDYELAGVRLSKHSAARRRSLEKEKGT